MISPAQSGELGGGGGTPVEEGEGGRGGGEWCVNVEDGGE